MLENRLVKEAREALKEDEARRDQQCQADAICAQDRLIYEQLLTQFGSPRKDYGTRFVLGASTVFVIPLAILGIGEWLSRRYGRHVWDTKDEVRWRTHLNTIEPLVGIEVVSTGGVVPAKSYVIDVRLAGMNHFMRYRKDLGILMRSNLEERSLRRANLPDAQKWHQFAVDLRQYTPHS